MQPNAYHASSKNTIFDAKRPMDRQFDGPGSKGPDKFPFLATDTGRLPQVQANLCDEPKILVRSSSFGLPLAYTPGRPRRFPRLETAPTRPPTPPSPPTSATPSARTPCHRRVEHPPVPPACPALLPSPTGWARRLRKDTATTVAPIRKRSSTPPRFQLTPPALALPAISVCPVEERVRVRTRGRASSRVSLGSRRSRSTIGYHPLAVVLPSVCDPLDLYVVSRATTLAGTAFS